MSKREGFDPLGWHLHPTYPTSFNTYRGLVMTIMEYFGRKTSQKRDKSVGTSG